MGPERLGEAVHGYDRVPGHKPQAVGPLRSGGSVVPLLHQDMGLIIVVKYRQNLNGAAVILGARDADSAAGDQFCHTGIVVGAHTLLEVHCDDRCKLFLGTNSRVRRTRETYA